MAGDARKKGGVYSDNPRTRKTRERLQQLPAQQRDENRKKFLEYRSLRSTCITSSKKADYQQTHSRDEKLAFLREACHNCIANRLKRGIDYEGTDIEVFVARFYNRAYACASKKRASASEGASTPSSVSEADGPNSDTEQPAIAHNGSQSAAPASSPGVSNLVDITDHHNGMADDLNEKILQIEEEHELILQEMSVRAYIQFQTAHTLRRLIEDADF